MRQNKTKQVVHSLLTKHSPTAADSFQSDCQVGVKASESDSIAVINQYFRDVLGAKPRDTMEARTYLVDDCCLKEWLSLLERGVIPEVVE